MFSVYIRDVLFKNLFIVVCRKFKLASSIYSSIHINIRNNKSNLLSLLIEVVFNNNKNTKKPFKMEKVSFIIPLITVVLGAYRIS